MGSDLGPLAWVLDELRKSLDGATKAMRRFVRDAELARGADLTDLDASQLRISRQQLHQAVGALEMVGLSAPAKVLRSMEALAQKFVQRPELCSEDAAGKLERASYALIEFLEGLLRGKTASPVALFPQYRAVQELAGADRIHPADLWMPDWRWVDITAPRPSESLLYSASVRAEMDGAVLKVVKTDDTRASLRLSQICEALAAGQSAQPRILWSICAGYFEAAALGLVPKDVYNKRAASRILQQYAALARGDGSVSDRLAQDLVFFCSLAVPLSAEQAPLLQAVRRAYALEQMRPVNYEAEQFGRFDPAVLALTRKRISAAAETWSALAGGDKNRLGIASEQFTSITDSMVKLHPESGELAHALSRAIAATVTAAVAPTPSVAMEVATTVLYLDAAYEDLDPTDSHMSERGARLAQRLAHVVEGGSPEPMEAWMEELYRRVSDRQTMGSVVAELRTSLNEVEKSLDQFFRTPQNKSFLQELPSKLAQMRGVFSVLGLDQPSLAALRMRASIEQFLVDDIDEESARTGIFEKLGNSLGAMGFLIDMLSYQRELAKRLFVYDEELGEFRPLMGRERTTEQEPQAPVAETRLEQAVLESLPELPAPVLVLEAAPEWVSASMPPAHAPDIAPADDGEEGELRDIFLYEAREVVQHGLSAVKALAIDPADMAQQTVLRRAFHTLKGSSRMVGLDEFGEAAWSFEQLLNTSLAEQRPVSDALIKVANSGMQAFGRWVEDIGADTGVQWDALEFRNTSDGLRLNGTVVPLRMPGLPVLEPEVPSIQSVMPLSFSEPTRDFAATQMADSLDFGTREPMVDFASKQMFEGFLPESEGMRPDFASTQMFDPQATQVLDLRAARSVPEERLQASEKQDFALGDFDFGEIESPAESLPESAEVHGDAAQTVFPTEEEIVFSEPVLELEMPAVVSEAQEDAAADQDDVQTEEHIKVIGPLRLSIPLYNVYLNEADEWSRRLQTELSEWALELHKPMPDSVVVLAHSLLGSSATVGFTALSEMARALEQALLHVQLHQRGLPEHAQIFNGAAEDTRRLLHQFAAGFLKPADESILVALQAISATEFPLQGTQSADELLEDPIAQIEMDAVVEPEVEVEYVQEIEPAVVAVSAAPLKMVDAHEDEMDAVDSLDDDLFSIFEEEAIELLPQLGTALRKWVARPDNLGARSEVLRVLHTLKGSARLAGAMRLGEMSHRMESSIELIGSDALQTVQLEPLLARFDHLQATFAALALAANGGLEAAVAPEATASKTRSGPVLSTAQPSAALAPPLAPLRQSANQSVRVRSKLLERMVNQAGEVLISRSRMDARLTQWRASLGDLSSNLDRLRQQLRDVELQAESQMQSRLAQTKDSALAFDPLEFDRFTRVQELTRMMAESVNDIATVQRNLQRSVEGTEDDLIAQGRQARELQRDLLRTRMVEFESLSERLYGVVRQAAKDAGKQVKLDISGGAIEMDRGVLDRMAPAFEHVLRNAVAHGIEDAALRTAAGKAAVGTITIHVVQESNDVSVAFSDDGGGLQLGKIRAKAIANGVIGADDALTDEEAANLISVPGFSTADQVTELAGRGIGMDVVRSEVTALGGRIKTATSSGKGTTFKLVLPLTTAVTQVVMLRMGEFTVGVPSNLIETVLRVPQATLAQAYEHHGFDVSGESIPFFWAGALLQVSARSSEPPSKTCSVAVVRSAGQRVALHVDEVLGNREVVVKNLGPQLALLPGLAGMSVLASGAVVLIYNPVALVAVYGVQARELTQAANTVKDAGSSNPSGQSLLPTWVKSAEQLPLVLVVDDSITVRRVTQRLLKREGYRVALAADGLQALEKLLEEKPAVVLSDIEMPRMDGFDLARNIRRDERLRDLPIIMITSRIAEKHRDHARELGVDHYLGKPYSEEELLGLVRGYCDAPVES
jgi:chemosensory pili system protein ChpA (sensor histidine kinase/response regulator)